MWVSARTAPPAQHSRGKAPQIADNTAPKRHNHIAAFHLFIQQPFHGLLQTIPTLGSFTRRQGKGCAVDACTGQPRLQPVQMGRGNAGFCQNGNALAVQKRRKQRACLRKQALANHHIIGARAQRHMNTVDSHPAYPSSTSGRVDNSFNTARAVSAMA